MIKVFELTKQNERTYLDQVAQLEEIVLEQMKKDGREGQLFITGKEDISSYISSANNTVMVATNESDKVIAATYITQNQTPFTYNDITKYFKYGSDYKNYLKSLYDNDLYYYKDLLEVYECKLQAFSFAKNKVLSEHPEFTTFSSFINNEISKNGFNEKSELREKINQYMYEYVSKNFSENMKSKYEEFYWINARDISQYLGKDISNASDEVKDYESYISSEYERFLKNEPLIIYEKPSFDVSKYFSANTKNSVELDTYLTSPATRNSGIARIIVYEGIKKHITKHFSNPENKEIYLCSTLHRDNLSSKYVSEFFGLKDSLFVNRRPNRDREVHICKIPKEQAFEYLSDMSNKLAVLYGYNPTEKHISDDVKKKVLKEQLEYEKQELDRLSHAKTSNKNFKVSNLKFIDSKQKKIKKLINQISVLNNSKVADTISDANSGESVKPSSGLTYEKEGEDYGEL